jgi:hypothetical protein
MSDSRQTGRKDSQVALLVILASVILGYCVRRPLADDAFITFRYAANMLSGQGLVYNAGEKVLGLSTPLWGMLLAVCKFLGVPFHVAALVGGVLGFACTLWLFYFSVLLPIGGLRYLFAVIPMAFLSTMVLATAFSGMETGIYLLAVFCAFHSVQKIRWKWAGVAAALATLLRPDGAVCFAIVCLFALLRDYRKLPSTILVYGAMLIPWFYYAWSAYGSPIPQSVAAKQVLHPSTPLMNLQIVGEVFARTPSDFLLVILGASGMIYLALQGRCVPHVLWCCLYLAGIIFSGLKPIFYWYFAPIWFCLVVLGSAGVALWLNDRLKVASSKEAQVLSRIQLLYVPVLSIVVIGTSLFQILSPDEAVERDNTYRQIGIDYKAKIKPGEVVYVGETGLLGFSFLDARILDSSGINSLAPYLARKNARDRLTERGMRFANMSIHTSWSLDLVKSEQPDWIIAPRDWCQMRIMEKESWFDDSYKRLEIRYPEHLHGIGIYQRKSRPSGE